MKKVALPILLISAIILFGISYLFNSNKPLGKGIPSAFCKPQDLKADITFQGAAGNIYGTLAIKNVSKEKCPIRGSGFVNPSYSATNINVKTQGNPGPSSLTLLPDQTVYSQIHYPNGPQCQGPIAYADVYFSYDISPGKNVEFKNQEGKVKQTIGVCKSLKEITEIDVWSLSEKPVNQ